MADGIDISQFVAKVNKLSALYPKLPDRAATVAVAFTKQRFIQQNWIDNRTEPWKPRKETKQSARKNRGRAILVKSGRLKRSPRKIRTSAESALIGTDVPYAAAHNYGFRGTETVKAHKRRGRKGKTSDVKSFERRMTIPRRQFMGNSAVLARQIERDFTAQIIKALQ